MKFNCSTSDPPRLKKLADEIRSQLKSTYRKRLQKEGLEAKAPGQSAALVAVKQELVKWGTVVPDKIGKEISSLKVVNFNNQKLEIPVQATVTHALCYLYHVVKNNLSSFLKSPDISNSTESKDVIY